MHMRKSNDNRQSGRVLLIVLGIVVVLAVAGAFAYKMYGAKNAEKEVAELADQLRSQNVVDMTYSNVGYSLLGDVVVEDVSLAAPNGAGYTVDRIVISDYDMDHDVPEHIDMKLENVSLPVDENTFGPQYRDLQEMGYQTLSGDLILDFNIDRDASTFTLNELTLAIDNMCTVSLSFSLGQVSPENIMVYLFDPSAITIRSASLSYEDHSLAELSLALAAKEEGVETEALRAEAISEVDAPLAQARQDGSELGVAFLEGFKKFLENPESFRLTANPPEPVTVGQLMAAETEFEPFDILHITTEVNY